MCKEPLTLRHGLRQSPLLHWGQIIIYYISNPFVGKT